MKKQILFIFILFSTNLIHSQNEDQEKDELLKSKIYEIVEELEFMYNYDQAIREYIIFKTFDKSETDSIEHLPDSISNKIRISRKFKSDSLNKKIWREYITPFDDKHTERLIEITVKYGFPSTKRLKKYYDKKFINREFNPLIIFIHSNQKKYADILKPLMKKELESKRINRCTFGYLQWHLNGRKNLQDMIDYGYKFVSDENGRKVLKPIDCD